MVTIHCESGLRVVIFTNDHEPAHVHIFGDGEAKIDLVGSDGAPELVWADGMKKSDVREAMRIVTQNQESFVERWEESHG